MLAHQWHHSLHTPTGNTQHCSLIFQPPPSLAGHMVTSTSSSLHNNGEEAIKGQQGSTSTCIRVTTSTEGWGSPAQAQHTSSWLGNTNVVSTPSHPQGSLLSTSNSLQSNTTVWASNRVPAPQQCGQMARACNHSKSGNGTQYRYAPVSVGNSHLRFITTVSSCH